MHVSISLSRSISPPRRSRIGDSRVVLLGASTAVAFGALAGCATEGDAPLGSTNDVGGGDVLAARATSVASTPVDGTLDTASSDAGASRGPKGIDGGYCATQFPGCQPFTQPDGGVCPTFDPDDCDRYWGWGEDGGASSSSDGSCCLGYIDDIKDAGSCCSQALNIGDWTLCLNLRFLQCINVGRICTGGVSWVTDAGALGNVPPRVTDREWCYQNVCALKAGTAMAL
jgi:hypothetical protein